jgi:putative protease
MFGPLMKKHIPNCNSRPAELLAPAGNMETFRSALYFGADAVYIAGKNYGLRAYAENFDLPEIAEAVRLARLLDRRVYLAVNAFFRNRDFTGFKSYLRDVSDAGVDAVIVSDPGVLAAVRETLPEMELHLSTQANTMNAYSARFWHETGVSRIVLARELSIGEIREIREDTPDTLALEAFVHGAMCISYSGRCLLSGVLTGRSANEGVCAQPCRWEYQVSTRGHEGQYFPVMEDGNGTYLFNSKDLCMIAHLGELVEAGVTSFKIEGRMKAPYYVASVVHAYRQATDDMLSGRPFDEKLLAEVEKAGTRAFTTGFYFGNPGEGGQDIGGGSKPATHVYAAKVLGRENGMLKVEQRNRFFKGDELEILSPDASGAFVVERIVNDEGEEQESAPHPQQVLFINCGFGLKEGDMLRKKT